MKSNLFISFLNSSVTILDVIIKFGLFQENLSTPESSEANEEDHFTGNYCFIYFFYNQKHLILIIMVGGFLCFTIAISNFIHYFHYFVHLHIYHLFYFVIVFLITLN